MQELKANIDLSKSSIQDLADTIEEMGATQLKWQNDLKSAKAMREKEAKQYEVAWKQFSDWIDTCQQAIQFLRKGTTPSEVVESLLQVNQSKAGAQLPADSLNKLVGMQRFGEKRPTLRLYQTSEPEATTYEYQSTGLITLLDTLQKETAAKKDDLEAVEKNAQAAYQKVASGLQENIAQSIADTSEKTALKAGTEQTLAESQGDLVQVQKDYEENQNSLNEVTALCCQKKKDYDQRQALRAEEYKTLKQAIEIMQGVSTSRTDSMLLQVKRSTALLQLKSTQNDIIQQKLASFLADRAQRSGSQLLAHLSERVASDPFSKVKKLIQDLITKLMAEATAEVEEKGFCDSEMVTNKMTRDRKAKEVSELATEIESLQAKIAELTQGISDLSADVYDISVAMAQATEQRANATNAYAKQIQEARDAQQAVERAKMLLKNFYAKSADATAFVQASVPDAPETFDSPYTGMQPNAAGVIGVLEVVLSTLAKLESETVADDAQENGAFDDFMHQQSVIKALKENESKHKSEKQADAESALDSARMDLKTAQSDLDQALAYYEKLKPSCVDAGISYAERTQRRQEEIFALQEAVKILSGPDDDSS